MADYERHHLAERGRDLPIPAENGRENATTFLKTPVDRTTCSTRLRVARKRENCLL